MKFAYVLSEYLTVCAASGKSHNTMESYARTLNAFGDWLEHSGVHDFVSITPAVLVSWKVHTAQQVSPASLRLYVAHIKGLFDFAADMEYVPKNPFKKKLMEVTVKDSDVKDTSSHVLTSSDFRSIFETDKPPRMHRRVVARNRAILALFLTSGIRCESLCRLTFADLFHFEHTIRISNAKGGKNGSVLLSTLASNAVRDYLESGYIPADCGWSYQEPLFGFVDASGVWTPYCREQMSSIAASAVQAFTGKKGFYAHSLRHTCASLLSASGLSDGEISVLLMHSDGTGARVTNRYIDRSHTSLFSKADRIFSTLAGSPV